MGKHLYETMVKSAKKKMALLIDPDKFESVEVIYAAEEAGVDYLFVGGSLISKGNFHNCVETIKKSTKLPLIIFPGNTDQLDPAADAILFLSLISGRNADNLIGKHVIAAPLLKKTSLEIIPTGYMLIDGGKITTATYMSNTVPIPSDKPDIAACTAMAGEMLGLKLIYMDAGSGALKHIPYTMIKEVKKNISIPLIIGGGIRTPEEAYKVCAAGADMIVIGTAAEQSSDLIGQMAKAVSQAKNILQD
ncbi:MAG TPA: geranylgeranylglyceryl/heptaprenylglyceryl phosphate synthase [Bacteroidia bacterium]|jgi:phosphoglycerol geranylgeranyltransferase|nr:geranylgeranylglyceryl/heptaprenylglyceryl phosphate synthase [Bacteroidia bacterium]